MNKVKLIALDLDGTLFNHDGIITPATIAELNRASKQGVYTVISTGRPFNGLPFEQIKGTEIKYALTTNGASVYRIADKKCLYENAMDLELIRPILDWILSREIHIDLYIDGEGFTPIRCRENLHRLAVPDARVADQQHNRRHQPREPATPDGRNRQHSHSRHRGGVTRHGAVLSALTQDIAHQPLQLGRVHRSQACGKRGPEVFQQARMFEDSRNHIAHRHSSTRSHQEDKHTTPAEAAPHYTQLLLL